MPKRTYKVVYDGQTFTRQTERTYTHVILVPRKREEDIAKFGKYGFIAWCGRVDLAHKELSKSQKHWPDAFLVEVPPI